MQALVLRLTAVATVLVCAAADGQEPVFSGPQVGEKLTPFKVAGAFDAVNGKEYDLVPATEGKPVILVFIHDLLANQSDEPSLGLAYVLMHYAALREDTNLARAIVCLTDDVTAMKAFLKKIRRALPKNDTPIGISLDGLEGPGRYGLNRNVRMTILIAKDNKVTANFMFSSTGAPRTGLQ